MKREEVEKWKDILKQRNPLGMPSIMFDLPLSEKHGEIYVELSIAKLIARLLPDLVDEALKIYLNIFTNERVESEIIKAKRNKHSIDEESIGFEDLIEEIVRGYLNASNIIYTKKEDLNKALEYIDKGIDVIKENPVDLKYISRGELYYTRWKILDQLGKVETIFTEIDSLISR